MSRNRFAAAASLVLVSVLSFGVWRQTWAMDAKTQYLSMASLDQYTMTDRDAEITLARSAAPTSISGDATVLVLEKSGYHAAVKGKNGFTCLVERSWMNPFDSPEFWNYKMRGPICYNPAAVRTILPYTINRTRLALTGLSKAQIREAITAAIAKNKLPTPEAGAMSYMMSSAGNLGDSVGHWCPHLMFHIPKTNEATWGANLAGSPVVFNDQYRDVPEPEMILMLPVSHWSDGTAAPHQVLSEKTEGNAFNHASLHVLSALERRAADDVFKPFSNERIDQASDTVFPQAASERASRLVEIRSRPQTLAQHRRRTFALGIDRFVLV